MRAATPRGTVLTSVQIRLASSTTLLLAVIRFAIEEPGPAAEEYLLEELNDKPHFGGGPKCREAAADSLSREQLSLNRLNEQQRNAGIKGELALEETEAEEKAAPGRPHPRDPDQDGVDEWREVSPVGRQNLRGHRGGRYGEEQHRDESQARTQAGLPFQNPQQQERDGEVQQEQRQFERGNRDPCHGEKRSGEIGLDAEHVVLAVIEQRERAAFDEVFAHQADDRLVGVEVGLFPEDEDNRSEEDEQDDCAGNDPSLTADVSVIAGVLFGHSRNYHMLRRATPGSAHQLSLPAPTPTPRLT